MRWEVGGDGGYPQLLTVMVSEEETGGGTGALKVNLIRGSKEDSIKGVRVKRDTGNSDGRVRKYQIKAGETSYTIAGG